MKVVIGNMEFVSDMEGYHDNAAYSEFLKAAVEVEKARANAPIYTPTFPTTWPQVPTYPAPIITCSNGGGTNAGND